MANAEQFEAVLTDTIENFRDNGVYEPLQEATGLSMDELEHAAFNATPEGAAPVAQVDPGLAFAAGLLVGRRHSEWQEG
jgi:hypothetical protein